MRKLFLFVISVVLLMSAPVQLSQAQDDYRRLPVREYMDKMKAGWIG